MICNYNLGLLHFLITKKKKKKKKSRGVMKKLFHPQMQYSSYLFFVIRKSRNSKLLFFHCLYILKGFRKLVIAFFPVKNTPKLINQQHKNGVKIVN